MSKVFKAQPITKKIIYNLHFFLLENSYGRTGHSFRKSSNIKHIFVIVDFFGCQNLKDYKNPFYIPELAEWMTRSPVELLHVYYKNIIVFKIIKLYSITYLVAEFCNWWECRLNTITNRKPRGVFNKFNPTLFQLFL